ncbi:MAG: Ni/Fe-hydrogenase cytochrome b subunit [Chloroflexi bacterium]|nr:Ni/Fe-hydrogenase cytochrome b subunit [Chloroflexota bacterium]
MSETAMEKRRLPIGTIILAILVATGLTVGINRFIQGLGATTNLTDFYPWGLWLGFDVVSGVALGSGAFTMAAIVYIFNLKKYRPILRPAILTGFIGYLLVIMGLLADLGQPHRIWHVIINWNLHSVLFEVGWCVMLYTTVMALELLPIVFERFNKQDSMPAQVIHTVTIPLVIAGVTLSTMHQNSLGALFLIMPDKLHPLWYSPILPVLFYVSAIGLGLAMVILESSLSSKAFKRGLEIDILSSLAKAIPYVLGLYLALKLGDLVLAGDLGLMFEGSLRSNMFLLELAIQAIIPIVLFSLSKVRKSPAGLLWSSALVVVGTVLNRINVSLIAPQVPTGIAHLPQPTYFPNWMEFALTIGLLSGGVLLFTLATRFLPIFPEEEAETH